MRTTRLWMAAAGIALLANCAMAADETATCRQILSKYADAVVKVQAVVKVTYRGEKRDQKIDLTGTVVDPSGLTVLSLMTIDPFSSGGGGGDADMTSEVAEIQIMRTDGTEVPGKVVLRDNDLDLAFIRPAQKPASPWKFVDLKNSTTADILDRVLVVNRLGRGVNRALSATVVQIQAVVDKPRRFYVISRISREAVGTIIGSSVFAMDEKLLGLVFYRTSPGRTSEADPILGTDSTIPIVVAAEDVAQVAAQAPEEALKEPAKPVEKPAVKPTAPKKK